MSVTKIFAVSFLLSASVAFAPAFADDRAPVGTQVAAVEAQLPVNPATEPVPTVAATQDTARTGPVLSAEDVRARLFGVAPVDRAPATRFVDADAELIRDVAGMYPFRHYRPLEAFESDVADSEAFETAAYVAGTAPN